jgi:hypothetical protein
MKRTLLFLMMAASAASLLQAQTFTKDVAPILQRNCQMCHRPGEAAPFSMLTYEETRPWAKAMLAAVVQKKMPPWYADQKVGKFANDRTLSQSDIDTRVDVALGQGSIVREFSDLLIGVPRRHLLLHHRGQHGLGPRSRLFIGEHGERSRFPRPMAHLAVALQDRRHILGERLRLQEAGRARCHHQKQQGALHGASF